MTGERVVRRRAAMLAADVVGHSRLMGRDVRNVRQTNLRCPHLCIQATASAKSGLLQPFEHMVPRLLRAELSGERPRLKEWP